MNNFFKLNDIKFSVNDNNQIEFTFNINLYSSINIFGREIDNTIYFKEFNVPLELGKEAKNTLTKLWFAIQNELRKEINKNNISNKLSGENNGV